MDGEEQMDGPWLAAEKHRYDACDVAREILASIRVHGAPRYREEDLRSYDVFREHIFPCS